MSPPTRENNAHYQCRASVGWRLATALYTKAGGTPKNVATGGLLDADMAYVGMPFDAQGGLEFVTTSPVKSTPQPATYPSANAHRPVPQPQRSAGIRHCAADPFADPLAAKWRALKSPIRAKAVAGGRGCAPP